MNVTFFCPHCGSVFEQDVIVKGKRFQDCLGKRIKTEEMITCGDCDQRFLLKFVAVPSAVTAKIESFN